MNDKKKFLQNCKKNGITKNVFYAIDFDLIKIEVSWAFQNDCHILNFMKATNVVDKKND